MRARAKARRAERTGSSAAPSTSVEKSKTKHLRRNPPNAITCPTSGWSGPAPGSTATTVRVSNVCCVMPRLVLERVQLAGRDELALAGERLALRAPDELVRAEHRDEDPRARGRVRRDELGPRVVVDAPRVAVGQRQRQREPPRVEAGQRPRVVRERDRRGLRGRRRARAAGAGAAPHAAGRERPATQRRAPPASQTRVSHSGCDVSLPRTTSKKRCWMLLRDRADGARRRRCGCRPRARA